MDILWLGSIFNEADTLLSPAISPAANRWQTHLLEACSATASIQIIGHRPEKVWPAGKALVFGREGTVTSADVPQSLVTYWNLPFVRHPILARSYLGRIRRVVRGAGTPRYVLSYNVTTQSRIAASLLRRSGVAWVPIIADVASGARGYDLLRKQLKTAAGCVFLSWAAYQGWSETPKLHLDGGVATLSASRTIEAGDSRVIFYNGALSPFGGVELLIEAFKLVEDETARLWICGKGSTPSLASAMAFDPRIKFFGFVPEAELEQLVSRASVFVNPRPSGTPGNEYNFPSKLLDYLSHGKPIVSTLTPGVSPDFATVLVVPRAETPVALAERLREVLAWSGAERAEYARRVASFVQGRTWKHQAGRLVSFLQSVEGSAGTQAG